MINVETVRFIAMLNELAAKTAVGFLDWNSTDDADEINDFQGILYNSENGFIVQSKCVIGTECPHKDIISYYDSSSCDTETSVVITVEMCDHTPEEEEEHGLESFLYVHVVCTGLDDEETGEFDVSNGRWYPAM